MQFLDVNYQALLDSFQVHRKTDGSTAYSFPFFFIMPRGTEGPNDTEPLLCRTFPPSFKTTALYSDPLSIIYKLRAVVQYRKKHDAVAAVPENIEKTEKTRLIDFLPFSDVQPPKHLASFGDEFVVQVTSPIWKHALGGRLGSLTTSTSEPLPLAYSPYQDQPSTDCKLSITAHAPSATQRLRAILLEVKPAIRVKTFYSAEPMPCLPKQTFLAQNPSIQLHDETIKLGCKEYKQLDWTYYPRPETDEPPPYEDAVRDDAQEISSTSSNLMGNRADVWKASVQIPIQPSVTLLPTFCSSLISRSYSLLLHVKVAGLRTRRANFEIPLQVVYLRPSQAQTSATHEESSFCIGPVGLLARDNVCCASNGPEPH